MTGDDADELVSREQPIEPEQIETKPNEEKMLMIKGIIFGFASLATVAGCGMGECEPDPKPGNCALQTCGNESAGNFQENYECRGPDDERWGYECAQDGGTNIRCETYGD